MPLLEPDAGPRFAPSSTRLVGLVDGPVWRYAPDHAPAALPFDDGGVVGAGEQVAIAIFPATNDGARIRVSVGGGEPIDLEPRLLALQWNLIRLDVEPGPLSAVTLDSAGGEGWLQVLGVVPAREPADAVDLVDTRRGTHSALLYSRGNTYPATGVPHGFAYLTPLTDARHPMWLYRWHGDPTPRLQGLAVVHQASVWLRNHGSVQVMPFTGAPTVDPVGRSRAFSHDHEVALPHHYRVRLADGVVAEMTGTSRAGVFRFEFPDGEAARGVTIDQPAEGELWTEPLPDGRFAIRGWMGDQSEAGFAGWAPRAYLYAETDGAVEEAPAVEMGEWGEVERAQARHLLTRERSLEIRLATSYLSVDQAARNLAHEVGARTFDEVRLLARAAWSARLDPLRLEGASVDDLETAYSSLYRAHLFPTAMHEPAPDGPAYASPFHGPAADGREETAQPVVAGEVLVTNGYWDTYRTTWPLHCLLDPAHAGWLLDGIAQQYRDGGWMARWSAPGYLDCMVGTSSDQIFANAALAGVAFDEDSAYESALRNALSPSEDPVTGRKGIGEARFLGWVPASVPAGFSWSIENAIGDAAISRWAADRVRRNPDDPRAAQWLVEARYLANRAVGWRSLADESVGFFQGRHRDGSFAREPGQFSPTTWGGDYVESTGWTMSASVPFDADWLAGFHGGRDGLARHLERLLEVQEARDESTLGGYLSPIHEMYESASLQLGQLNIANQPAHHLPWMFLHTPAPWRASEVVHRILDRSFGGGEIGQGWPGDEDNGEMSAWWLFASLGLYPLDNGGGDLAVTAPRYERAIWTRADGTTLTVAAPGRAEGLVHVAGITVNGVALDRPVVPMHSLLGDAVVEVDLSAEPTGFGVGRYSADLHPGPHRRDLTGGPGVRFVGDPALIDDLGETPVSIGEPVVIEFDEARQLDLLTVTLDEPAVLVLTVDGDERRMEAAPLWPNTTVPVDLSVTARRLTLTAPDGGSLRQVEVFGAE